MTISKTRRQAILAFALVLLGALLLQSYAWYVKMNGVYAIAKKVGINKGGKNGSSSRYEYHFNNRTYGFSITDHGSGKDYVFIKMLKTNPSSQVPLADLIVPDCVKHDSLLGLTWNEMPNCK